MVMDGSVDSNSTGKRISPIRDDYFPTFYLESSSIKATSKSSHASFVASVISIDAYKFGKRQKGGL